MNTSAAAQRVHSKKSTYEGLLTVEDTKKEYKRKEMRNCQERWQNKALHDQYFNDTDGKQILRLLGTG